MTLWAPGSRTPFELIHHWSSQLEAKQCFRRTTEEKAPSPCYGISFLPWTLEGSRAFQESSKPVVLISLHQKHLEGLFTYRWAGLHFRSFWFNWSEVGWRICGLGPYFENPWSKSWVETPGLWEHPQLRPHSVGGSIQLWLGNLSTESTWNDKNHEFQTSLAKQKDSVVLVEILFFCKIVYETNKVTW